jgi:hypothetical protein
MVRNWRGKMIGIIIGIITLILIVGLYALIKEPIERIEPPQQRIILSPPIYEYDYLEKIPVVKKLDERIDKLESLIKTLNNDREINTKRIATLENAVNILGHLSEKENEKKEKEIKAVEITDEIIKATKKEFSHKEWNDTINIINKHL